MKYRKIKITFMSLLLISVIVSTAMRQASSFTVESANGKTIKCERGKISVPELRTNSKSNLIEVKYIRLKSFSDQPETPIFYLAGGPGNDATGQAENANYLAYWSEFLKTRDVVLIDQRGVGKWKMWWINLKWPPRNILVSSDVAVAHFLNMGRKAAKAFKRRGIDLNGYNSVESAHDIDLIRQHLSYNKIIPLGFSYGTTLAQAYIKYHEEHVERAILMGVEGLNDNFKIPSDLDNHFEMIAQIVEGDSAMSLLIPDFIELYHQASEKLLGSPLEVTISTPIKLKRKVMIGKFGLDYILKRDLGDAGDLCYFPRLLYSIVHGDGSALAFYAEKRYKEFMGVPGMMVSMDMASGGSPERIQKVLEEEKESIFGNVANLPFMDMRNEWPVQDLGSEFRTPLLSDVPTLLLSGSLDINTPSYQAEIVKSGLRNGIHLIVENAGHEQIQFHWQMTATVLKFLAGEDVSDISMAYPPLEFKPLDF